MKHEVLKQVILDQHEVIRRAEIIPRAITLHPEINQVVTGLRRAGKSTLLYGLARKLVASGVDWNRIIFINFEDERLAEMTAADLNDILAVQSEMSDQRGYFFLDEIQIIPEWEKFARRMADRKESVQITGSNARMLSREIGSTLGGRYLEKNIWPYSFDEYLNAIGTPHGENELIETVAHGRVLAGCNSYLKEGGLPETLRYPSKRDYISSVYQKILLGDIVTRNSLRNSHAVALLIKKIAETVMREVSYANLYGNLKAAGLRISKDTIIDYVDFITDTYLVFKIYNHFSTFSERETTPKYYFADNGLLSLFLTDKKSALLENAAAIYLKQHYGEEVCYIKSSVSGLDIDFYIPSEQTAIQVCLDLNDQSSDREISNLLKASSLMHDLDRLIIVTSEGTPSKHPDYPEIDLIPIDIFLLKGFA
ncbi:MAG: ATP-binding protein [Clostridia bacterium]|nr:ATP-binding protein [Clostridia bacterium]